MSSGSDRGILYAASGREYVDEAISSSKTLAEENEKVRTLICTEHEQTSKVEKHFNEVRTLERSGYNIKIGSMIASPFERTLFLDTDTHVCASLEDLFDILDRFDIAAAHSPIRHAPIRTAPFREDGGKEARGHDIPLSFPEFNTGVVAFKKSTAVEQLLHRWLELHERHREKSEVPIPDQPSFREAAFESAADIAALTPEWNFRLGFSGYVQGQVRILHGRMGAMGTKAKRINRHTGPRVFVPGVGTIRKRSVLGRIVRKIAELLQT